MWFHLGFGNFIGKKNITGESCDIYISDFSRIWHKSLPNNEILSISKELNPLFEAPVQRLKDVTLNLLEDVGAQKDITEDDSGILLKLHSNIMGVRFRFEVQLKQGDGEMLYKEFTLPMLLLLIKIQNREKKLIKIIQDKDAEIEDYKQEFGNRPDYMTTKPFNEKEFDCEGSETINFWDHRSFIDCISSKILSVKEVPEDIKKEESLGEEASKKSSNDKCDKTKKIFKDKNAGSKPCLFLDNQTIKRRRKHDDRFKIKF